MLARILREETRGQEESRREGGGGGDSEKPPHLLLGLCYRTDKTFSRRPGDKNEVSGLLARVLAAR